MVKFAIGPIGSGGGGGGGGGGVAIASSGGDSPASFGALLVAANIASTAVTASGTNGVPILTIPAIGSVWFNVGGFTVEAVADGTRAAHVVIIPEDGIYAIAAGLRIAGGGTNRRAFALQASVLSGTTTTYYASGSAYYRGIAGYTDIEQLGLALQIQLLAGDKVGITLATAVEDSATFTLDSVRSHFSIVKSVSGGSTEGWISHADSYDTADIGKYLIDQDGQLKQVERSYEAGHAKTVGGVASPGDFYDIPGADEGGGPGQHFRGWHTRGQPR